MLPANLQHNPLLARLQASGRRVTQQRGAVCAALMALGGHPTAKEIWRLVHAMWPSTSQATVYNTIAALEELRLIRKIEIAGDEHAHYDMDTTPHVNVACTHCGQIVDVYTDRLEDLLGSIASRTGYSLAPQAGAIVYGLCASCAGPKGA